MLVHVSIFFVFLSLRFVAATYVYLRTDSFCSCWVAELPEDKS